MEPVVFGSRFYSGGVCDLPKYNEHGIQGKWTSYHCPPTAAQILDTFL